MRFMLQVARGPEHCCDSTLEDRVRIDLFQHIKPAGADSVHRLRKNGRIQSPERQRVPSCQKLRAQERGIMRVDVSHSIEFTHSEYQLAQVNALLDQRSKKTRIVEESGVLWKHHNLLSFGKRCDSREVHPRGHPPQVRNINPCK